MKKEEEIRLFVDNCVFKGELPIAFFDSDVVKVDVDVVKATHLNKRYMHSGLPEADTALLISKIFSL